MVRKPREFPCEREDSTCLLSQKTLVDKNSNNNIPTQMMSVYIYISQRCFLLLRDPVLQPVSSLPGRTLLGRMKRSRDFISQPKCQGPSRVTTKFHFHKSFHPLQPLHKLTYVLHTDFIGLLQLWCTVVKTTLSHNHVQPSSQSLFSRRTSFCPK